MAAMTRNEDELINQAVDMFEAYCKRANVIYVQPAAGTITQRRVRLHNAFGVVATFKRCGNRLTLIEKQ